MQKNIIFIGAPGSGKGTQAYRLVSEKGYKHLSTGDLLRKEIAEQTDLGKEVKAVMDDGKLVSDDLVIKLLAKNTSLGEISYIFDGFPRTLAQAESLDRDLLKESPYQAVFFQIDEDRLVDRLANRRTCQDCGKIYNLLSKKPKEEGTCDACGGTNLVQRKDDKPEVVKNRLSVYHETIGPVLEFYESKGKLAKVNAQQEEDIVFEKILKSLQ